MEFLAVFYLFWECKTRVHSWLAKPLIQTQGHLGMIFITPGHSFGTFYNHLEANNAISFI